jgi:hypothetical protein
MKLDLAKTVVQVAAVVVARAAAMVAAAVAAATVVAVVAAVGDTKSLDPLQLLLHRR